MRLLEYRPASISAMLIVLALFVGIGYSCYRNTDGQDLASSYVGSRMLIEGLDSHLFQYDKTSFAEIGEDDTWLDVAHRGGAWVYLHPYVQTPLWAYSLKPLCRHVQFWLFNRIFVVLNLLAFAGTVWLVARYWAPSLFHPIAYAIVLLLLCGSVPFRYAMYLNQTHILIVFLTVAALLLAERDWPFLAGFLLAYSASIKVTPIFLILYWLMTRRWKAASSTLAWSAVLWIVTRVAVGHDLSAAYLQSMQRVSHVLLLSLNNQSFATWVMQHFYPVDEVYDINIYTLPTALRIGSMALLLLCTAWGGWLDYERSKRANGVRVVPFGAMIAILAATIFAPIAWVHYGIVLVMPLMMIVSANRELRNWWVWAVVVLCIGLNYHPFTGDVIYGEVYALTVIRGQFFACLLTMLTLGVIGMRQRRSTSVTTTEDVPRNIALAA